MLHSYHLPILIYLLWFVFCCSHLGPPRRRTTAEEEERAKHPKPEVRFESDDYHVQLIFWWTLYLLWSLIFAFVSAAFFFFFAGLCLLSPYSESYWGSTTWKATHVQVVNRSSNFLLICCLLKHISLCCIFYLLFSPTHAFSLLLCFGLQDLEFPCLLHHQVPHHPHRQSRRMFL